MKRCLSFFFFFFPALAISQNDDMKMISQKDASELWTATWFEAPVIEPEEDGDAGNGHGAAHPDPIGYKGANFQRFYIRFSTVVKTAGNMLEYTVTGTTGKNAENPFKGNMVITSCETFTEPEFPGIIQGTIRRYLSI